MTGRVAQDVVWGGYEVFDPGVGRPLAELSRRDARAAYGRLMAAIPDRLCQLRMLLDANAVDVDDLAAVDEWFFGSVEEDAGGTGRLAGVWYSVVNDIGFMLGERVIASTNGALRWEMVDAPKKDMSFQRHVIRGFDVANSRYYADFDLLVGMYEHRIVRGEESGPGLLERLLASWRRRLGSQMRPRYDYLRR